MRRQITIMVYIDRNCQIDIEAKKWASIEEALGGRIQDSNERPALEKKGGKGRERKKLW